MYEFWLPLSFTPSVLVIITASLSLPLYNTALPPVIVALSPSKVWVSPLTTLTSLVAVVTIENNVVSTVSPPPVFSFLKLAFTLTSAAMELMVYTLSDASPPVAAQLSNTYPVFALAVNTSFVPSSTCVPEVTTLPAPSLISTVPFSAVAVTVNFCLSAEELELTLIFVALVCMLVLSTVALQ